ncbi:MAG: hypothetical protein WEC75_00250 [Dehalococcoidia bacterium]
MEETAAQDVDVPDRRGAVAVRPAVHRHKLLCALELLHVDDRRPDGVGEPVRLLAPRLRRLVDLLLADVGGVLQQVLHRRHPEGRPGVVLAAAGGVGLGPVAAAVDGGRGLLDRPALQIRVEGEVHERNLVRIRHQLALLVGVEVVAHQLAPVPEAPVRPCCGRLLRPIGRLLTLELGERHHDRDEELPLWRGGVVVLLEADELDIVLG